MTRAHRPPVMPGSAPTVEAEGEGVRVPRRALVTAFVAVTVSFVISTAYSQHTATRIDRPALDIARNAAPSIQHLAAARAELRSLQLDLIDQLNALEDGLPVVENEVRKARVRLDAQVRAYLVLPFFPGERRLWLSVQERMRLFDHEVDRVLAALRARDRETARRLINGPLDQVADRVSDALYHSVSFNADQAARLAVDIEITRHRSFSVAVVLNVLSAVAAIFAAVVVLRVLRSSARLAQLRSQLLTRQARELEAFAGRVAHDILSPLGTVVLAFDLLQMKSSDDSGRRLLERSRRSLLRVKSIVEDLLTFARSGAAPKPGEHADLQKVVQEVVHELDGEASAGQVTLAVELEGPAELACATGVLASIVSNLVKNAIKYLGERPVRKVCVRSRALSGSREGHVRVEVIDSGPGIAAELQEVIFLPHVRGVSASESAASPGGLGLGLATVKLLVQAHGGSVGLESVVGSGSTFWFELACVPAVD
jgi:signal transduction histidine kinase